MHKLVSLPALQSRHSHFVGVDVTSGSLSKYHKAGTEEHNDFRRKSSHVESKKDKFHIKFRIKYFGEYQWGLWTQVGLSRQDPGINHYKTRSGY